MSDELQKALAEMLKTLQAGKDFVLAEAPDVIQQLIRWSFWEAVLYGILSTIIASVCLLALRRLWMSNQLSEWDDEGNPLVFLAPLGLAVPAMFFIILFVDNVLMALKISIAPKVWLIEWAMRQVKS